MPAALIHPYSEGTAFCVPLESGGYAIGVVARRARRGRIAFGYFFGPRQPVLPSAEALDQLDPQRALTRCRFGDLRLVDRTWPILGTVADWDRAQWPMPWFYVPFDGMTETTAVRFDDEDPTRPVEQTEVDRNQAELMLPDEMLGSDYLSAYLDRLLGGTPSQELTGEREPRPAARIFMEFTDDEAAALAARAVTALGLEAKREEGLDNVRVVVVELPPNTSEEEIEEAERRLIPVAERFDGSLAAVEHPV